MPLVIIGRKEKPAAVGIEGQRRHIVNRTAAHIGQMFHPSRVEMDRREIRHWTGMPDGDIDHVRLGIVVAP